ncbi:GNAT family N-acetyltransferase [Rhodanobacter sp. L36]|uniref:GNAT family N-acetyltransferase n=1 Tax=Rhodanobacter sp. L36 TaxID=1747221 RepID=UPI001C20BA30|nr:GNAT family N-acetyltransferase [Rhodanobacter sp. L36]
MAGWPQDALTTRVIEDMAAWDAIRDDWNALHALSPTASTTLDFVWLRGWWQVYGDVYGAGGLRIITLWRDEQLVGALPLYIEVRKSGPFSIRCLRLISTGEAEYEETCPDYLDLLHVPGEEKACARAAWSAMAGMDWHTLELLDLSDDSPLRHGQDVWPKTRRVKITTRGNCPIADLGDGFEAYLAQRSHKTRARARQELRKVEESGASFELADASNADEFLDDLIRVHQQRWTADGKPGCFSAPRFTQFHRQLVREWTASGRAVLARLSHQGKAGVVLYGFVTGRKFDLYQLGVTSMEETTISSPGMAANLLLMARLAERAVTSYDFLRGLSPYKKSLTTSQRELIRIGCNRPSALVWFDQVLQLLTRARRKFGRVVFRPKPEGQRMKNDGEEHSGEHQA